MFNRGLLDQALEALTQFAPITAQLEAEAGSCRAAGGLGAPTPCCTLFSVDHFAAVANMKIDLPLQRGKAVGVQARLNRRTATGGSPASPIIVAGWLANAAPNTIARGHQLGRQLGGWGTIRENLLPIYQQTTNIDMRSCENQVRAHINLGEVVDYEVKPVYDDPAHPAVPTKVLLRAMSLQSIRTCWSLTAEIVN